MKSNVEVPGRPNKPDTGHLLHHSTYIWANGSFALFTSPPSVQGHTCIHAKSLLIEPCAGRILITGTSPSLLIALFCRTVDAGGCADTQQRGVKRQLRRVASTMHLHEGRHHCKTDKIPGHAGVGLPFSGWWYRYFILKSKAECSEPPLTYHMAVN